MAGTLNFMHFFAYPYRIVYFCRTMTIQSLLNNRLVCCCLLWWLPFVLLYGFDPMAYTAIQQQMHAGDLTSCIQRIEKELKKDKNEAQWYWLLDDVYLKQSRHDQRIAILQKGLKQKKLTDRKSTTLRLATAYFDSGDYQQAEQIYKSLPLTPYIANALEKCRIADSLRKHPVEMARYSMGDSINTPFDNLWPSLTANGKIFCSTVVVGKRGYTGNPHLWQEDIYISEKKNGVWQPAKALPKPINTKGNEGASYFSADGKYLFFVRCNEQGGHGSCDIYYMVKQGNSWSQPILADAPLNSEYWESNPMLSASQKEIYFSSNRPGGMGKKDIWKCDVQVVENGLLSFSHATCLRSINTPYDEVSPFLHANDSYLYFSSNGHAGMGGLDVFYSQRTDSNQWSQPCNIGYPINTYRDEMGWAVSPDGKDAYLSGSLGEEEKHRQVIYRIELPHALQPTPVSIVQQLQIDGTYRLTRILFATGEATLLPASHQQLNELVQVLQENPNLHLLISGHTDNQGSEAYNLQLSQKRADSVVAYLVQQGISPARLQSKGYGFSQPIESNTTERGRAQNRRIEASIIPAYSNDK